MVIVTTNIGNDGCIGLITNFTAILIICEIDDIMMDTAIIQNYKLQKGDEFLKI